MYDKYDKGGHMYDKAIFQFIDGISLETFETDEQFRSGRIGTKVGNKVRITWDGTNTYEYVPVAEITKIDRDTYIWDKVWNGTETGHIRKF